VVPGISLHLNMRGAALVQGNREGLYSATRDAARMAFVDKDLGTVEEGKRADLIAAGGNPLRAGAHAGAAGGAAPGAGRAGTFVPRAAGALRGRRGPRALSALN